MHDVRRLANLLGATGLAVADLAIADAADNVGVSTSAAAALVVLSASDDLGVTELGRRVGLSQSAAARMVDGMEAGGLARRRPGAGRGVSVRLTKAGQRGVSKVLAARGAPLTEVLDVLDDDEQAVLGGLLERLLDRFYDRVGSSELLCRLCDREACVTDAACPVGAAERRSKGT